MHTIRLRHPWQSEIDGDVTVWSRKFNWPAELPDGETVRLVVEPADSIASVTLNDQTLALAGNGRADITEMIGAHNRLSLQCAEPEQTGNASFPFDVRLEISS